MMVRKRRIIAAVLAGAWPAAAAAMIALMAPGCGTIKSINPFAKSAPPTPSAAAAPSPVAAQQAYTPPPAPPVSGEPVDSVVASVDGEPITTQDVSGFSASKPGNTPDSIAATVAPATDDPNSVLKAVISEKLIENEAKNYADRVDEDEVNRYIQSLEAQNHITDDQLRAQLQQQGMSYGDFRTRIRKQVETMAMIDKEVRQKIIIPEAEIGNYYKDNPEEFTARAEKYRLAQILIAVPSDATPKQITDLQDKAEKVDKQAAKGDDFASLALQYSDDDSKTKGGELGEFTPTDINDSVLAAIKELKDGGISPVVRTKYGFHIVKVEEHVRPGLKPLEQVRGEIRDKLMTYHAKEKFQKWVDTDLVKQHYVETIQP